MTGSAELTVRPAGTDDIQPLAAVLARAFYDDPPFVWLLPDAATRLTRATGVFATILRAEAMRHEGVEVACNGGHIVAGAIWLPPGHWQHGLGEQLRALPGYLRALGRRLGHAAALAQALARAHPTQPHWYLYAVGVDPSWQGRGVSGMLLRSRLRRCDQAGLPAYLEATKPASVPLYQHFGFQPTTTPAVPDGAPALTAMWRDPGQPPLA